MQWEDYEITSNISSAAKVTPDAESHMYSRPMIGENRQLVTDEPVEFEKEPVEVQDCREIANHFREIYRRIYPNFIKENPRMSTCNRLDLQALGSQPILWVPMRYGGR